MNKKNLKKRIKELEVENIMLRAMAMSPVYIYLYAPLPYNPYWQPYQWYPTITSPVTCEPEWIVRPEETYKWVVADTSKYTVRDDWTVVQTGYTVII